MKENGKKNLPAQNQKIYKTIIQNLRRKKMLNTYIIFTRTVTAKYPLGEIESALKKQYEHPKLTERLANLKKLRVNLSKETENPWFGNGCD